MFPREAGVPKVRNNKSSLAYLILVSLEIGLTWRVGPLLHNHLGTTL